MPKILITGAHFTPAQAVIEQLQKTRNSDNEKLVNLEIVYIGRKTTMEGDKTKSIESKVLPQMGIKYRTITTGRLRRYLSLGTLVSLLKIPLGFIQSLMI